MILLTTLFAILFGLLFILYRKYEQKGKYFKNIPYPPPNFLFGNLLDFAGPSHVYLDVFKKNMEKYGDTLILYDGPSKLMIATSDPKFFKHILSSTHFIDKFYKYENLEDWLGTGLLTSGGKKWKSRRRMITPAFHFSILNDFIDTFEKVDDIFLKKLEEHVGKETYNILPLTSLCTLDIISEAAMGTSVNALLDGDSEYLQCVKKISKKMIQRNSSILTPSLRMFTLSYLNELLIIRKLHAHTDAVIAKRKAQLEKAEIEKKDDTKTKKRWAFLDLLLKSTIDGKPLSKEDIREEVDTFMFEGHDTTSIAIALALYSLANNPKVQEKALNEQKEIFDNFKNINVTSTNLHNMKYLELIIKEAMRLYPSVPWYGRKCDMDIEWEGSIIRKGTAILMIPYITQRDSKYFPNPLEFIPERFAETDCSNPYKYIPFSAGSRNCIGQKFAMLEMKSTLSKVIRNFELLPAKDNSPLELCPDLTLGSNNGVRLSLRKRIYV